MKNWLFYFFICMGVYGWGQNDTIYLSDWEYKNQLFENVIGYFPNEEFIDYASGIEREYFLSKVYDPFLIDSLVADDWLGLFHGLNTLNRQINFEDSTYKYTQRIYRDWNIRSNKNEVLTLPIGLIYKQKRIINTEAYQTLLYPESNGDVFSFGISSDANLTNFSTLKEFFAVSVLFDEEIFDQEIYLTLDSNYTQFSDKTLSKITIQYANVTTNLSYGDSLLIRFNKENNFIKFITQFNDSTEYECIQNIVTDISWFENNEKSSPFTGGTYTFTILGGNLPINYELDAIYSIEDFANIGYRLRYGIIWGACNNSGKLNKPIFMLHGFRPDIQPFYPNLKKLYDNKFNFKGNQYGSDGFVDLLVKNGYDVVICRIDPGFSSIRAGGRLLSKFFETVVEPQKAENNSKYENIVYGFSMGGHYWRNMLMYDEHEHLNLGENRHHHTRMWIPIDSPLEGANNPLAHQFAAKSVAEDPAGFPVFNISYNNMLSIGSQQQQRYDVNGIDGNDGAFHRFHLNRTDYINEMENTFYLGSVLTKYRGYPSSTRNIGVSVGSNTNFNYYELAPSNVPLLTYNQNSFFPTLLGIKHWEVQLHRAYFIPSFSSSINDPVDVFKRKIYRTAFGSTNVLVDDHFETYNWHHLDNCNGSYLNAIKDNVNNALNWNSLLGFNGNDYDKNQIFVPTLSALAISPQYWPHDMRYNLKTNKLMFDELGDDITDEDLQNSYFGYPHLGRPFDYQTITPMDAIFCDEKTYEHITLIDDEAGQDDQSELITFLLNEIQPWFLDLQNQNLGEYARPNYTYSAKYEARNLIQTGREISPKTPFGDYIVEANADLELKAGEQINLTNGTHIKAGAIAHLYIEELCYSPLNSNKSTKSEISQSDQEKSEVSSKKDDDLKENLFKAYPNPNSGKFSVSFSENQSGTLYAYTIQGKCMGNWIVENESEILLQQTEYKGLIFLTFISDSGVQLVTKIIIK